MTDRLDPRTLDDAALAEALAEARRLARDAEGDYIRAAQYRNLCQRDLDELLHEYDRRRERR